MLGIIINPKSGKRAFRRQRIYLWKLLRKRREPFVYRVTKYAEHAIELGRELVERGCDEILVLGGDGTLSEVINGIMRADIPEEQRAKISFGIMPRGTGNDWGRFWGLTKDFKKSLNRFFNGEKQPLDVGCVTYWRNGIVHHRYFINSVGFGVDSLTCQWATTLKYYIGSHHVNYFFALLAALCVHKSLKIELIVDGKTIVNDMLFTMNIGNGPFSGGGIKQNPDADPRDGVFHSIFVQTPTFRQVLKAIPRLFDGRLTDLDFVHSFVGKEVEVNTRKHLMFEADGILENIMGPCRITCLHNALSMKC
ncbi:MAG: YegS/Rv2252/BmrU family lipid kinase [Paludibacteraceae bacterium]|nr:YegS/Rv2252/BmrU family lipid kinase [Paludibacteraceae bacterium]